MFRLFVCCVVLSAAGADVAADGPRSYAFPRERDQVIGSIESQVLRYEDTLAKVARSAGVGLLGVQDLNPDVDPWLPGEGTEVRLPTSFILPDVPFEGMVINLSERRLYYFDVERERLLVYPIGIGSDQASTPLGVTKTVLRIKDPSWTPPESVRAERLAAGQVLPGVVPPGPNNPLGEYAIQLGWPGYFIHGTNQPIGVGGLVSHGCIRLYPDHIEELATSVPNGTDVRVVAQPYKVGWRNGLLYLEAHRADAEALDYTAAMEAIVARAESAEVDWTRAIEVARTGRGIPEIISRR